MQAVILIGGRGTRLRPLTDTIPKGLVEIGGRPFLEYLFLYLKRFGICDIRLCTGYRGEQIEERFGDGSDLGLRISYSREGEPLGTGGALKKVFSSLEEEFFLLNGDTLLPSDYRKMQEVFTSSPGLVLLSAFPTAGTGLKPNLRLGEGGAVTAYRKSDDGKGLSHVDAGVSLFRKEVGNYFPPGDKFSLEEEVYPRLIEAGRMRAWEVGKKFYDVGTPEGVRRFEDFIRGPGKDLFKPAGR